MPEGPEVETVRRTLEPHLVGRRFEAVWTSRLKLRNAPIPKRGLQGLVGRRVRGLGRRGKQLWIELDDDGLLVRLGMTGQLTVEEPAAARQAHTHLVVDLDDGQQLRYRDPRRFGDLRPYAGAAGLEEALADLGPDASELSRPDVVERVWQALSRTDRALKDVLLDQRVIAGLGNIYVCEALHLARLSPFRRGTQLKRAQGLALLDACLHVYDEAVRHRGTTFSDFVDGYGREGGHQQHLRVFQREGEPCPECGRLVRREVQSGRSTFFCAKCQPRPRAR